MHPWLLPSPLLSLISRRIVVGGKGIAPTDMGDAEVLNRLVAEERVAIVQVAIERIAGNGRYMAALRERPLGPALKVDGPARLDNLTEETRGSLIALGKAIELKQLDEATWGRVLTLRRQDTSRVDFALALAEVEWRNVHTPTVSDTAELRAKITELLRDPRIDTILDTDLRYSWRHLKSEGSLVKLLSELRAGPVADLQRRYVEKLWRGFQLTLAEDIDDIAGELVQRGLAQPAARMRAVEIFAARFGARPISSALEAVAKHHGVSGARISTIVQRVIDYRGTATLASPAANRLLAQIPDHEFLPIPLLEQKLELRPGKGDSLATLRRFLQSVLFPVPELAVPHTQAGDTMGEERKALASSGATPKHLALIRLAQRQCRAAGAASLTHLAGIVALSGRGIGREDLEQIIDGVSGARWIDRDHGWFVLDDLDASLIHHRVRKIFAVAHRAVHVREIGEALYRDGRLADETEGEFAIAPQRVLKLAMLTWDGIAEERPGWLIDRSGRTPADVLSSSELKLYEVLAERGGVAPAETVVRLVGGNAASMRAVLHHASFAYAPMTGIYALRGWKVGRSELLAALAERATVGQADRSGATTVMVIRPKETLRKGRNPGDASEIG